MRNILARYLMAISTTLIVQQSQAMDRVEEQSNHRGNLNILPDDKMVEIMSYFSAETLNNLSLVCKNLYSLDRSFRDSVVINKNFVPNTQFQVVFPNIKYLSLIFTPDVKAEHISSYAPNLISLDLAFECLDVRNKQGWGITDDFLALCTNLQHLGLNLNPVITINGLSRLTTLTSLNLRSHTAPLYPNYGKALISLTNLKKLNLADNLLIKDNDFSHLTNLEFLEAGGSYQKNPQITGQFLPNFKGLKTLCISYNTNFLGNILPLLNSLESLSLGGTPNVTNEHIAKSTNLTFLYLNRDTSITADGLTTLQKLKWLQVYGQSSLTDVGVSHITSLTRLDAVNTNALTPACIPSLINLVSLCVSRNRTFTEEAVKELCQRFPNLNITQ